MEKINTDSDLLKLLRICLRNTKNRSVCKSSYHFGGFIITEDEVLYNGIPFKDFTKEEISIIREDLRTGGNLMMVRLNDFDNDEFFNPTEK